MDEREPNPAEQLVGGLEAKQRNTVWPGPMVNGSSADGFLWKGDSQPTLSMRAGAFLIGMSFLCGSLMFGSYAIRDSSIVEAVPTLAFLYLVARVLFNSLRKTGPKRRSDSESA